MSDGEQVSLVKLNTLIRHGKEEEAHQYITLHNITRDTSLQRRQDDVVIPCLSPLSVAAEVGYLDLIKVLIERGFGPQEQEYNNADIEEWKPIHYACCSGHLKIVKYFIEDQAIDVESPTGLNWTLLQHAINYRHYDMVKYLVEAGAAINRPDGDPMPPINIAVMCDFEICKYLVSKGADVNARDIDCLTSLFLAVERGSEDLVEFLLAAGADVNVKKATGETPLSSAISKGFTSVMKILICHGADTEIKDFAGRSLLHKALYETRVYRYDIIFYLIVNTGLSVDQKDRRGRSPLYFAVKQGHMDAVELLVRYGLDISCETWLFDNDSFVKLNLSGKRLFLKLRDIVSHPRSLKDCCIGLIRQLLGKSFSQKVGYLPLPQSVKDYIALGDLKKSKQF